ncbi:MAG: AAA family ATPase [Nocardioidaceae bacterium]
MRVHSLEITAFGPFPGHEVLDFEPLYEAGLFLLTGNTGAGKTSVLDAICFGLFGSVPGARGSAKELKSHHAAQSAEPTISLDVTIKSRRFRVRRSPAWQRPSSRSKQGYVAVNAKATLEELVEGRWTASSSRLDEIGQQISAVLGMNRDQFCQVVMLPQGQFHTFLRAGAKERHDVLESLFETSRFQRIEKWLSQQRLLRDQDCQAHQTKLVEMLARAHEVAASLPCSIDTISNDKAVVHETLASGATFVDFTAASGGLRDLAESAISAEASALLREQLAGAHLKAQQHLLDEARALLERQSRLAEATQRREALEATREEMQQRERQVERARAADACAPLLRLVRQTDVDLARANDGVSRAQCACAAFASHPEDLLAVDDVALNVEQLHARGSAEPGPAADGKRREAEPRRGRGDRNPVGRAHARLRRGPGSPRRGSSGARRAHGRRSGNGAARPDGRARPATSRRREADSPGG